MIFNIIDEKLFQLLYIYIKVLLTNALSTKESIIIENQKYITYFFY